MIAAPAASLASWSEKSGFRESGRTVGNSRRTGSACLCQLGVLVIAMMTLTMLMTSKVYVTTVSTVMGSLLLW